MYCTISQNTEIEHEKQMFYVVLKNTQIER